MSLLFERVCQEDLNVGTGTTTVTSPTGGTLAGTQIGLHSLGVGQASATATVSPGQIAIGSYYSTTIVVPGATVGDFVVASHDKILDSALVISAHVSAADTVRVVFYNPTASPITPASGTIKVLVLASR